MEVSPDSTTQTLNMYDYINNFFMTPSVFIILFIVIAGYVILFVVLGRKGSSSDTTGSGSESSESTGMRGTKVFGMLMMGLLLFLVVINGLQYFFGIDIMASVKNLTTGQPEIDIKVDTTKQQGTTGFRPQVFNIPGNEYGYFDAQTLCKAYGARLATYSEIEKAYEKGAEWCNYGWSDGQMALFPTQQKTFDKLQTIEGHENDCGRPGVNGGIMANPHIKFGVNCYGYKPRQTNEEKELMLNTEIYPKTAKDKAMEQRVQHWKEQIPNILVSPFNHSTWSKI